MRNENFFDESSEQSKIKSLITSKYFWAWAKVIIATAKKYNRIPKIALLTCLLDKVDMMMGQNLHRFLS